MYLNNAKLSISCQLVVTDFCDLKMRYREEQPNANDNRGLQLSSPCAPLNVKYPFLAIVSSTILFFCWRRIQRRRLNMHEMRDIAKGIETDPALNAQRKSYFRDCLYQNTV